MDATDIGATSLRNGKMLPAALRQTLLQTVGEAAGGRILARMRPPGECMTPAALSAVKASRLSLVRLMAERMISERWRIDLVYFDAEPDGSGRARYIIEAGAWRMTYIVRCFPWSGAEKVGRRSDGLNRDMFSALFFGMPDEERVQQEFDLLEAKDSPHGITDRVFGLRDVDRLRTNSDIVGFIPANRSSTGFDGIVDALVRGVQPELGQIYSNSGYILRNAGFLGSGRNGTRSFEMYPADHPFSHPYFADAFGLYLIRQVSIDLVNATARARNPDAAQLSPAVARHIGVGNSSGQGMCVALQRWPQWVATWMLVRELAIAHACCQPVRESGVLGSVSDRMQRVAASCVAIRLQSEEFVVPPARNAANLRTIAGWLPAAAAEGLEWGDLAKRAAGAFDPETAEQFHSILIDAFPDFARAVAGYYDEGMRQALDSRPESTVREFREQLRTSAGWALKIDRRLSRRWNQFWYHSVEGGEQRRGVRGIDPHEEFESFIDHIGLFQIAWCKLANYPDDMLMAEVIADDPALHFVTARVQTLCDHPYAEIRGNLVDEDTAASDLIRFYLATLGMEFTSPLSKRYVRGVFLQGMPSRQELAEGASPDWTFPDPDGGANE